MSELPINPVTGDFSWWVKTCKIVGKITNLQAFTTYDKCLIDCNPKEEPKLIGI